MTIYIGTSGWSYGHWRHAFYPQGLPPRRWLEFYSSVFDTTELNSSFYRWPRPAAFTSWRDRLPPGFRMSVKAPRGLTHARRLYGPEGWISKIQAGWHELGGKRGVLLMQLPPAQARDDARLEYLLEQIPDGMKLALELRHPSWHCEHTFALLERHRTGYCIMSGARLPCILRVTADFAYVRLHGPDHEHLYAGSYSDEDLSWWASRITEWTQPGRDVFVYLNNDGDANAVRNAQVLKRLLGLA